MAVAEKIGIYDGKLGGSAKYTHLVDATVYFVLHMHTKGKVVIGGDGLV